METPGEVTKAIQNILEPLTEIALPQSLIVRAKDGNWRRFLVWFNTRFMISTPNDAEYYIEKSFLHLNGFQFIKGADTITIVDPPDGFRWIFMNLEWINLY